MEVQSPSVKRHYDITMSRRTRKQQIQVQQINNEKPISKCDTNTTTTTKDVSNETNNHLIPNNKVVKESDENDHKSLKQLIVGDEKDGGSKGRNSSSLGEHFTEEEKQLQLVRMQQKDNIQGLKFKKLVSRYAKVLGHLMKAKRDPHLADAGKKPVFKLST